MKKSVHEKIEILSHDENPLIGDFFSAEEPAGMVLIAHGMGEHRKRYYKLAEYLQKNGYSTMVYDHRGHGDSAPSLDEVGHFSDKNGWFLTVEDMKTVVEYLKKRNPELPLYIVAHSMGSLIARSFIVRYSDLISGAVFSGSAGQGLFLGSLGKNIANIEVILKRGKGKSPLMNFLVSGTLNREYKPARTPVDWITSDDKEVDKYIEDPYCGRVGSAAFYRDLFSGILYIRKPSNIRLIRKDLPIFFISGAEDPVGEKGKGVQRVVKNYRKSGIKDVSLKLYNDGRHEIFNEKFYLEVFKDIISWLEEKRENFRSI